MGLKLPSALSAFSFPVSMGLSCRRLTCSSPHAKEGPKPWVYICHQPLCAWPPSLSFLSSEIK